MNCLLLLVILFCCGGNGKGCIHEQSCDNSGRNNSVQWGGNCREKEFCESVNHSCHMPPPPMPRTQFPYLDVEPRTCGCEEK